MGYALRDGLAWCLIQGRPVFLDVVADRYFALDGESARALLSLADVDPAPPCPDGLHSLTASGIVRWADATTAIAACSHPPPTRSISFAPGSNARGGLPRVLFALAEKTVRLRLQSLASVLAAFEARKRALGPATGTADALSAIALRYHRSRRVAMPLDHCLVRAVALAGAAVKAGHGVTLVFGVQLRPFGAHCWVEHDAMVLDDSLDHVRRFAPILAL